jgi:hypothetical protein
MDTAELFEAIWNWAGTWAAAGAVAEFVAKSTRDRHWKQQDELAVLKPNKW